MQNVRTTHTHTHTNDPITTIYLPFDRKSFAALTVGRHGRFIDSTNPDKKKHIHYDITTGAMHRKKNNDRFPVVSPVWCVCVGCFCVLMRSTHARARAHSSTSSPPRTPFVGVCLTGVNGTFVRFGTSCDFAHTYGICACVQVYVYMHM